MKRASVLLVFLATIAVVAGIAGLFGWFGENKPDHPEIVAPATQWKTKRVFIDSCLRSYTTVDSAQGNANRELQLCICLAEKVEAKYPQGISYSEASKTEKVKELGADYCYK